MSRGVGFGTVLVQGIFVLDQATFVVSARMADEEDEEIATLEKLWKSGRVGTLSPLEQLRAWAYRDVLRERGEPEHGMLTKICAKVVKVGGGTPICQSMNDFFSKVDEDLITA